MELRQKQDVYAMGLVIYEVCHVHFKYSEKASNFRLLKNERKFPAKCPYVENELIEFELIKLMTEPDAQKRPTAEELVEKYIPLWEQQLNVQSLEITQLESSE